METVIAFKKDDQKIDMKAIPFSQKGMVSLINF